MNIYPKVLVISNNCFSKTDSNGRTLAGFFYDYPKDKLAQFYIQNATPDFEVCNNYFRVTDSEALSSFLKRKKVGKRIFEDENQKASQSTIVKKKKKRTPFTMLLRELVWKGKKWRQNGFSDWIDEFNPEVVMIQVGDNAFMLKIATDIAINRKIPLVVYNCETYYFKKKNYMKNSGFSRILYPCFIKKYRKQFEKTMRYTSHAIYICEELKDLYQTIFDCSGSAIYTSSSMESLDVEPQNNTPIISYLGNLGVGRHKVLIDIANALQKINTDYKLDVYGKLPNEDIKKEMLACNGINYKGFVSYDEVVSVMRKSDLLVHAESFSKEYREDLKYAFSTKIADTLSSGTCFFYYAPDEFVSQKYLSNNKAAITVTDKDNLQESLESALIDQELREKTVFNAKKLFNLNHNYKTNQQKFYNILEKVVHESNSN